MRLIDADALIDAIDFCVVKGMGSTIAFTFKHIVDSIPTIEAEQRWIPCSERLPDVGRDVIFCDAEWAEEGCLRADGDWWQFRWSTVMPKEKVLAWMPLPKPYKGGDSE